MENPDLESVDILIVEDSPGDAEVIAELLQQDRMLSNISFHIVGDGKQAINYLYHCGDYAGSPRPDLILLDLYLPGKTGIEILCDIKKDNKLKQIPIIILSSSTAPEDIRQAYCLHANGYVEKPIDLQLFIQVAKSIENFWSRIVNLPPKS